MPVERISRGFKDISMSFQANPLNDDLIGLKNENAIARAVKNIVFTLPGEKYFNPNFGSKITNTLFQNVDDISATIIVDEIRQSIINYEPRVALTDVQAEPNFDNNEFNVTVTYDIVGIDALPQQLNFALQPTR